MTEVTEEFIKEFVSLLQKRPKLREYFVEILEPSKYVHRDEFAELLEELKLQRQETAKNFAKMDQRFEEQRIETNKRFEEQLEAIGGLHQRINRLADNIKRVAGDDLELLSLSWFKAVLEARGFPSENLQWKRKFEDKKGLSGATEVEIDIFQENPLMAVEVTPRVNELNKIDKFIRKLAFLEDKFGQKPRAAFITYGIDPAIEAGAKALLKQQNILLHTINEKLSKEFSE